MGGSLCNSPGPFLQSVMNKVKLMAFNDYLNHLCEREVGSLLRELWGHNSLKLLQNHVSVS